MRAAGAVGIPVIYQELGVPWMEPVSEHGVFYDKVAKALPFCSEVAALSPDMGKICRERLPFRGRISVLPLIVEDTGSGSHMARDLPDNVVFGFAGRFEWRKAPTIAVEAFAETLKRVPGARLVMAGQGGEEGKVRELAMALGIGPFCEFVSPYTSQAAKRDFMKALDVLVLSSYAEGTPNSLIEAMAHGRPIIATAVGGVPDVVTPDVGMLVPPGDVGALAAAMTCLATDPELRIRMGSAARKRYEELFSPRSVLPLLVRTYERVARRNADGMGQEEVVAHPWAAVSV
jgi:glycosyltransferase involved in cell wall biosynthesis